MEYLHDFRKDIVSRKRDKKYWKEWDNWNILYKTLAYELSSSGHVESYDYVMDQIFSYFPDCEKYIEGTPTLDVMNGWWFCFKTLFGLGGRGTKETRNFLCSLKKQIKNITEEDRLVQFISQNYNIQKAYIQSLLGFLDVVYTIGNMAPVNKNIHADVFDSWEYKLFQADEIRYNKNSRYEDYFAFCRYCEETNWSDKFKNCSDPLEVVSEYMDSRITIIKERGQWIVNRKTAHTEEKVFR